MLVFQPNTDWEEISVTKFAGLPVDINDFDLQHCVTGDVVSVDENGIIRKSSRITGESVGRIYKRWHNGKIEMRVGDWIPA